MSRTVPLPVDRLKGISGFSIDSVARAAGTDPDVLRLENLDTDIPPPEAALSATRHAVSTNDANSYLPFEGTTELRAAVAYHLHTLTGIHYRHDENVLITCGGTEGLLDTLLATTDPGDEVVVTDPTYAGMIFRVRLAGAIPRFVPFVERKGTWRLDLDALGRAITPRTRAMFLMNPSMPSGAVFSAEEWSTISSFCVSRSLWLIYNAAMERILFDGAGLVHPATLPGMLDRTIIVGSLSKEFRMIGWRIGWVAGPAQILGDIGRVHTYNVVSPPGIAQPGAVAALVSPAGDLARCIEEWERRRNLMLTQLDGYPVIPPAGGWSLLLNVRKLGLDPEIASRHLLERGRVAATPMTNWGDTVAPDYVRFVFSNESTQRLAGLRDRMMRTFGNPASYGT